MSFVDISKRLSWGKMGQAQLRHISFSIIIIFIHIIAIFIAVKEKLPKTVFTGVERQAASPRQTSGNLRPEAVLFSCPEVPPPSDLHLLHSLQERFEYFLSGDPVVDSQRTPEEDARLHHLLLETWQTEVRQRRIARQQLKSAIGKQAFTRRRRRGELSHLG